MKTAFTTLFFLPFLFLRAQDNFEKVQWACEVTACSQQYEVENYSSKMALGAPDVFQTRPRASSYCYLFGFREKEDDRAEGEVFLTVKFCNPQKANRVLVAENFTPGSITGIYLLDAAGKETRVYESAPKPYSGPKRLLQVEFPYTNYEVHGVKITGEPRAMETWSGIDGIGIADSPTKIYFPIKVENLGPAINSELPELGPRISPGGRTLYYSVEGHPSAEGRDVKDDDQDIWYSELNADGEWSPGKTMGKPWNNKGYNWVVAIMPDGNTAILSNHYDANGDNDGSGVSRSYRTANGWSMPQSISITNLENKANNADYFLSNDGKVLLMAIEGPKKVGNHDLYVSFQTSENTFSEPLNMGKTLNTKKYEYAPFLAADGKTLYFSSDGHGGFGNNDIFVTRRLDDSWTNWTTPENLGAEINSDGFDSDFSIAAKGDYAYLVKYDDSYGSSDVIRIPLDKSHQPDPIVLISGRVLNKKTNAPLMAGISYEDLGTGQEIGKASSEPQNGSYKIVLPYGKHYGFMAQADGFYAVTENIDLSSVSAYQEITRDLYLAPIEVGEVVRLNNVFFESGKSELLPASFPELDRVVKLLKDNPGITIELAGHTDNVGADEANQILSDQRANSVRTYLTQQGTAEKRITAKGYGETVPVATNDTDEGRQLNRRVEFKIVEK
ncbi:MAG: OmpA family protein [Bacteroidia bacterium]|nr:OmpA family protein [Bacteroidia bacterium]